MVRESWLTLGIQVHGFFYGNWFPAFVKGIIDKGPDGIVVEVLWEEEYPISYLPIEGVQLHPVRLCGEVVP